MNDNGARAPTPGCTYSGHAALSETDPPFFVTFVFFVFQDFDAAREHQC